MEKKEGERKYNVEQLAKKEKGSLRSGLRRGVKRVVEVRSVWEYTNCGGGSDQLPYSISLNLRL